MIITISIKKCFTFLLPDGEWGFPCWEETLLTTKLLSIIISSVKIIFNGELCRGLECKSRQLRNTWGNRQIWPWNTEWSRAKTERVLPRKCTGHSKHPLPTTQEKTLHMDITRWSTPNQIDYILCSQRWRSSIQSAKTRPEADCGSDHELFIAKFRLKLKKVGKTTWPFR